MNNKPMVLFGLPIIATKDADWVQQQIKAEPGAIWLLPEDAVLIMIPPQEPEEV